jgi:hypothetical protein
LAERVAAVHVVEHEQAGGHLPAGYADLVRDFIAEWKEAGKFRARRGPRRGGDGRECPHTLARRRPALGASRPFSARWGLGLVSHNRDSFGVFYLSTALDMTCRDGSGACPKRPGF